MSIGLHKHKRNIMDAESTICKYREESLTRIHPERVNTKLVFSQIFRRLFENRLRQRKIFRCLNVQHRSQSIHEFGNVPECHPNCQRNVKTIYVIVAHTHNHKSIHIRIVRQFSVRGEDETEFYALLQSSIYRPNVRTVFQKYKFNLNRKK